MLLPKPRIIKRQCNYWLWENNFQCHCCLSRLSSLLGSGGGGWVYNIVLSKINLTLLLLSVKNTWYIFYTYSPSGCVSLASFEVNSISSTLLLHPKQSPHSIIYSLVSKSFHNYIDRTSCQCSHTTTFRSIRTHQSETFAKSLKEKNRLFRFHFIF